jgi:RNA polymerase sigma factor (sigma-70 family)
VSQRERTETEWGVEIARYEGLVKTTAGRYERHLDDEFDDICAVLRVTVWKALVSFSGSKSSMTRDRYVFSCVVNRCKDLLRKKRHSEHQSSLEDILEENGPIVGAASFTNVYLEARLLSTVDEGLRAIEEGSFELPSTLTAGEREVLGLLYLDYRHSEIAEMLGLTRQVVEKAARSIREKMADWRPSAPAKAAEAPAPARVAA